MQYGDYSSDALMTITNRPDLVFVRGEGSWLHDHNGNQQANSTRRPTLNEPVETLTRFVTKVTMVRKAPFGGAFYIKIDNIQMAMREREASSIYIQDIA